MALTCSYKDVLDTMVIAVLRNKSTSTFPGKHEMGNIGQRLRNRILMSYAKRSPRVALNTCYRIPTSYTRISQGQYNAQNRLILSAGDVYIRTARGTLTIRYRPQIMMHSSFAKKSKAIITLCLMIRKSS